MAATKKVGTSAGGKSATWETPPVRSAISKMSSPSFNLQAPPPPIARPLRFNAGCLRVDRHGSSIHVAEEWNGFEPRQNATFRPLAGFKKELLVIDCKNEYVLDVFLPSSLASLLSKSTQVIIHVYDVGKIQIPRRFEKYSPQHVGDLLLPIDSAENARQYSPLPNIPGALVTFRFQFRDVPGLSAYRHGAPFDVIYKFGLSVSSVSPFDRTRRVYELPIRNHFVKRKCRNSLEQLRRGVNGYQIQVIGGLWLPLEINQALRFYVPRTTPTLYPQALQPEAGPRFPLLSHLGAGSSDDEPMDVDAWHDSSILSVYISEFRSFIGEEVSGNENPLQLAPVEDVFSSDRRSPAGAVIFCCGRKWAANHTGMSGNHDRKGADANVAAFKLWLRDIAHVDVVFTRETQGGSDPTERQLKEDIESLVEKGYGTIVIVSDGHATLYNPEVDPPDRAGAWCCEDDRGYSHDIKRTEFLIWLASAVPEDREIILFDFRCGSGNSVREAIRLRTEDGAPLQGRNVIVQAACGREEYAYRGAKHETCLRGTYDLAGNFPIVLMLTSTAKADFPEFDQPLREHDVEVVLGRPPRSAKDHVVEKEESKEAAARRAQILFDREFREFRGLHLDSLRDMCAISCSLIDMGDRGLDLMEKAMEQLSDDPGVSPLTLLEQLQKPDSNHDQSPHACINDLPVTGLEWVGPHKTIPIASGWLKFVSRMFIANKIPEFLQDRTDEE